ncbi:MAG TPA: hypothetical protein VHV31_11670 [Nitrolancea sp.]|nr:hypothetical protein [Nitrolancea sp.]
MECGTPFTRREAARTSAPRATRSGSAAAVGYRRYERRSGLRRGLLAWLAVTVVAVVAVIALIAFFSTSVVKPYVGRSVNQNLNGQLGSTIPQLTPNSGASLAGQTLVITQQQINDEIAKNADSLHPLSDVSVQIVNQQFIINFSAYGVSGRYEGQAVMRDGKPVLTNGHISGALGWVVSTSDVETAFNREIAAAVDQAGVQVSSVALQPGQMVLTLAS